MCEFSTEGSVAVRLTPQSRGRQTERRLAGYPHFAGRAAVALSARVSAVPHLALLDRRAPRADQERPMSFWRRRISRHWRRRRQRRDANVALLVAGALPLARHRALPAGQAS